MDDFEMDPKGGADRVEIGATVQQRLAALRRTSGLDPAAVRMSGNGGAGGAGDGGRDPFQGHRDGQAGWNDDVGELGAPAGGEDGRGDDPFASHAGPAEEGGGDGAADPFGGAEGQTPDGYRPDPFGFDGEASRGHDGEEHNPDPFGAGGEQHVGTPHGMFDPAGDPRGFEADTEVGDPVPDQQSPPLSASPEDRLGDPFGEAAGEGEFEDKDETGGAPRRRISMRTGLLGAAVVGIVLGGGYVAARHFLAPSPVYHPVLHPVARKMAPAHAAATTPSHPVTAATTPIHPPVAQAASGASASSAPAAATHPATPHPDATRLVPPATKLQATHVAAASNPAEMAAVTRLQKQVKALAAKVDVQQNDISTKLGGIRQAIATLAAKRNSARGALAGEVAQLRQKVEQLSKQRAAPATVALPTVSQAPGGVHVMPGYQLTGVSRTAAAIVTPSGQYTVQLGQEIRGAGIAKSLKPWHGTWELVTSEGVIRPAIR